MATENWSDEKISNEDNPGANLFHRGDDCAHVPTTHVLTHHPATEDKTAAHYSNIKMEPVDESTAAVTDIKLEPDSWCNSRGGIKPEFCSADDVKKEEDGPGWVGGRENLWPVKYELSTSQSRVNSKVYTDQAGGAAAVAAYAAADAATADYSAKYSHSPIGSVRVPVSDKFNTLLSDFLREARLRARPNTERRNEPERREEDFWEQDSETQLSAQSYRTGRRTRFEFPKEEEQRPELAKMYKDYRPRFHRKYNPRGRGHVERRYWRPNNRNRKRKYQQPEGEDEQEEVFVAAGPPGKRWCRSRSPWEKLVAGPPGKRWCRSLSTQEEVMADRPVQRWCRSLSTQEEVVGDPPVKRWSSCNRSWSQNRRVVVEVEETPGSRNQTPSPDGVKGRCDTATKQHKCDNNYATCSGCSAEACDTATRSNHVGYDPKVQRGRDIDLRVSIEEMKTKNNNNSYGGCSNDGQSKAGGGSGGQPTILRVVHTNSPAWTFNRGAVAGFIEEGQVNRGTMPQSPSSSATLASHQWGRCVEQCQLGDCGEGGECARRPEFTFCRFCQAQLSSIEAMYHHCLSGRHWQNVDSAMLAGAKYVTGPLPSTLEDRKHVRGMTLWERNHVDDLLAESTTQSQPNPAKSEDSTLVNDSVAGCTDIVPLSICHVVLLIWFCQSLQLCRGFYFMPILWGQENYFKSHWGNNIISV